MKCCEANQLQTQWYKTKNAEDKFAYTSHLAACPVCRGDIDYTLGKAMAQDPDKEPEEMRR